MPSMSPLSRAEIQRNYRERQRAVRDVADDPISSLTRAAIAITRNAFDPKTPPIVFGRRAFGDDRAVELLVRAGARAADRGRNAAVA
jgi:hypothetical protein